MEPSRKLELTMKMYNRVIRKCEELYDFLKPVINLEKEDLPLKLLEEMVNIIRVEEVARPLDDYTIEEIYKEWKRRKVNEK